MQYYMSLGRMALDCLGGGGSYLLFVHVCVAKGKDQLVKVVTYARLFFPTLQRPSSRSSRENMYDGSHDNREKYAYQQQMIKRKKPSQY